MKRVLRVLLCYAVLLAAAHAGEGTWPTRPIKLIVPTGPGAATDVERRCFAQSATVRGG
jgi:tripartite-type tricarboxylate transporter receptor subunit TctC